MGENMNSAEIIKACIEKTGAKTIAAEMGLSESMIYKWAQGTEGDFPSGARNPLDRIREFMKITSSTSPLEWLCEEAGGFFVLNPHEEHFSKTDVLQITPQILKEFSEMLEEVSVSISNDGIIDEKETARIRSKWEDLKKITEHFVVSCENGVFNGKTAP